MNPTCLRLTRTKDVYYTIHNKSEKKIHNGNTQIQEHPMPNMYEPNTRQRGWGNKTHPKPNPNAQREEESMGMARQNKI